MKRSLVDGAKGIVLLALFFIGISAPFNSVDAATISISNYNFETGGFSGDNFSRFPGTIPTGWSAVNGSISGDYYGYLNPDNNSYTGTAGNNVIGTMDGPNMFYFGSATDAQGIFQTLTTPFSTGTDYALTVASGARSGGFMASLEMQLFAGSTMIANQIVKNTSLNTIQDFTLNYTANSANDALAGQNLMIRFLERDFNPSTDFEVDIDNVRLTSSVAAIPEPSTYLLLTLGVAAIVLGRRCRRA